MERKKLMDIGFLGLGNLGMPLALSFNLKGHKVIGYDLDPAKMQKEIFSVKEVGPDLEPSIEPLLKKSSIKFAKNITEVVEKSDIIFVVVQTPNFHGFDGTIEMPYERKNYDLTPIQSCLQSLKNIFYNNPSLFEEKIIVINSTLLPGTIRKMTAWLPLKIRIVHNPMFCAMGTVIPDIYNPEFILLGGDDKKAIRVVEDFYKTINYAFVYKTSFENAEMIKTCYNAFITFKIVYANTLMEMAHKIPGCNVDKVVNCLILATNRLLSTKYLRGGMGDAGGCHPKENMALSWLSKELNLSYDLFENNMKARELQTKWLADLICEQKLKHKLPVILMGVSFKAETNLLDGSAGLLLNEILKKRGVETHIYDPEAGFPVVPTEKAIYFMSMNLSIFKKFKFPKDSIVLDPWRYLEKQEGVELIKIGNG